MRILLLASAALAALTTAARAQTVEEVVVTRLPARLEEVTGLRVVDRVELEARQTPFAADVLSTIPGVGIARNGAFGGVAAIRIRGASPDKTLVLIDGVPVGDPADPSGAYDPSSLQTADLERIEVLSGPQGSLWGSEAIGGVVSFTTRELDGVRAELEGGRYSTARAFAGAGLADERYALNASVAAFRTDGVSKAAAGTEDDGFRTVTANAGGRFTLSQAIRLDGRVRYTRSTVDIDGFPPPTVLLGDTPDENKTRAWSGYARATADAFGLTHQLSVSAYDLRRRSLSSFPSTFDADRQVFRWTAAHGEDFVLGAERQETSADLSGRPSLDLSNTSVFAVGRLRFQPLTLTASVRHDDPARFHSKTTGRLAAALALPAGFTATVSAGTGFKTPTISQAICDFCSAPPVELRPERAEGYDLRLGWANDRVSAAVTGWRILVRDQIAFQARRYVNIAKTSSQGLEAELDARFTDSLRLRLAYAWIDAIDRTTTASLLRVPDRSGAAALFWQEGPWSAALTARAESSQSDTARNGFTRIRRKGFVTADASGAYALNERISLTARIENLADRRYQETFGYGEPGRSVYVGVRLRN
jgi:vitamin B12 transporter